MAGRAANKDLEGGRAPVQTPNVSDSSINPESLSRALEGKFEVEYDLTSHTVWYQQPNDDATRLHLPQPVTRLLNGQTMQLYHLDRVGDGPNDFMYTTYELLRNEKGDLLTANDGSPLLKPTRIFWFSEAARNKSAFTVAMHFSSLDSALGDRDYQCAANEFYGNKGCYDTRLDLFYSVMDPEQYSYADFKTTQAHEAVHRRDYQKGDLYDLGRHFGPSAAEVRAHLWQGMLYRRLGDEVPDAYRTDKNIIAAIRHGYGDAQGDFAQAYIAALRAIQAEQGLGPDQGILNVPPDRIEAELPGSPGG